MELKASLEARREATRGRLLEAATAVESEFANIDMAMQPAFALTEAAETWQAPSSPPDAVRFASVRVSFDETDLLQLGEHVPNVFRNNAELPVGIDLHHHSNVILETGDDRR